MTPRQNTKTGVIVVGSALGGIVLFLVFLVAYTFFGQDGGDPKNRVLYAPQYQEKFIELLNAEGIEYQVDEKGWVQYSQDDRERVERIEIILFDHVGPEYSVIEVAEEDREAAEIDFKKNGVEYMISDFEDRYVIRWRRQDNSKVRKMLEAAPYYKEFKLE